MTDVVCLYRPGCLDGIATAWVVDQFVEGEVIDHTICYNTEPDYDLIAGKHLYIAHPVLSKDTLNKLEEVSLSMTLIASNPHVLMKTTGFYYTSDVTEGFVPSKESTKVVKGEGYCHATLMWKHFTDSDDFPWHLKHMQHHVLWTMSDKNTLYFIEYIKSHGIDRKSYGEVVSGMLELEVITTGKQLYDNFENRLYEEF